MALADKYQSVVDAATNGGIQSFNVQEQGDVLYISGDAPSEEAKQAVWDAYTAIDPDMRAGDLVLAIAVSGQTLYTVQSGDNLTRIASHHNVSLEALEAANKETVANPNLIFPGQQLVIPAG